MTVMTQSYADNDDEIGRPLLGNATITCFLPHQHDVMHAAAIAKTGDAEQGRDAVFDRHPITGPLGSDRNAP